MRLSNNPVLSVMYVNTTVHAAMSVGGHVCTGEDLDTGTLPGPVRAVFSTGSFLKNTLLDSQIF